MYDPRATELARQNDIVGLFRYLGPMWIVPCLQILEDLLDKGLFYPNVSRYQQELRSAGIFVERMEVAMSAVLHKNARQITDEKFEEIYKDKLAIATARDQAILECRGKARPARRKTAGFSRDRQRQLGEIRRFVFRL